MKRISVSISDELAQFLDEESRLLGVSKPEKIRDLLESRQRLRRKVPFAALGKGSGEVDASRVEEYLEAHWADEIRKGWAEDQQDGQQGPA